MLKNVTHISSEYPHSSVCSLSLSIHFTVSARSHSLALSLSLSLFSRACSSLPFCLFTWQQCIQPGMCGWHSIIKPNNFIFISVFALHFLCYGNFFSIFVRRFRVDTMISPFVCIFHTYLFFLHLVGWVEQGQWDDH